MELGRRGVLISRLSAVEDAATEVAGGPERHLAQIAGRRHRPHASAVEFAVQQQCRRAIGAEEVAAHAAAQPCSNAQSMAFPSRRIVEIARRFDEALFSLHGPRAEGHDAVAGREGSFDQVCAAITNARTLRSDFQK